MKTEFAIKAKEFLDFHPAFSTSPLGEITSTWKWGIERVCRRNKWESQNLIDISKNDDGWEKFKNEFDEQKTEIISKSYEEIYGEKWQFDHYVYWCDFSFYVFRGNLKSKDWMELNKWGLYSALFIESPTFEDLLIDSANQVEFNYGNFSVYNNSIMTNKELENNNNNLPWSMIPSNNEKGYLTMMNNDEYFNVHDGYKNLRWLKWFITTDFCKKNWEKEFDFVNNLDLYPYGK